MTPCVATSLARELPQDAEALCERRLSRIRLLETQVKQLVYDARKGPRASSASLKSLLPAVVRAGSCVCVRARDRVCLYG